MFVSRDSQYLILLFETQGRQPDFDFAAAHLMEEILVNED
jgi:hypothetical protein